MNFRNIIPAIVLLTGVGFATGCKKESANIFNMFDVKLTLRQTQPGAIGETADITATDSVVIDYALESPTKDMYMVCLYKTGSTTPAQKIPITEDGKRRSYSGSFKLYAKDLGAGTSAYRIWALDKDGVYLGDGYKTITINVISDLRHLPMRKILVPDSVGGQNEAFLSLDEGKTYSYTTGGANSAKIDFGIYQEIVVTAGVPSYKYSLYSLSATPIPFKPYDFSSWTKRTTLFSAPVTGSAANFRSLFSTGAKMVEDAKKKTINLKQVSGLASNQFVYFLTPEGRYGVLFVQSINYDYSDRKFLTISYKIQN